MNKEKKRGRKPYFSQEQVETIIDLRQKGHTYKYIDELVNKQFDNSKTTRISIICRICKGVKILPLKDGGAGGWINKKKEEKV